MKLLISYPEGISLIEADAMHPLNSALSIRTKLMAAGISPEFPDHFKFKSISPRIFYKNGEYHDIYNISSFKQKTQKDPRFPRQDEQSRRTQGHQKKAHQRPEKTVCIISGIPVRAGADR